MAHLTTPDPSIPTAPSSLNLPDERKNWWMSAHKRRELLWGESIAFVLLCLSSIGLWAVSPAEANPQPDPAIIAEIQRANQLLSEARYPEALAAFQSLQPMVSPDQIAVQLGVAKAHYHLDSVATAQRLLDQLLKRHGTEGLVMRKWGDFLVQVGNWELAAVYYAQACKFEPGMATHWKAYGQAMEGLARPMEAMIARKKALQLQPEDHLLRRQIASSLHLEALHLVWDRNTEQAWQLLNELRILDSDYPALGSLIQLEGGLHKREARLSLRSLPKADRQAWRPILLRMAGDSLLAGRGSTGHQLIQAVADWDTSAPESILIPHLWKGWQQQLDSNQPIQAWESFQQSRHWLLDSVSPPARLVKALARQVAWQSARNRHPEAESALAFLQVFLPLNAKQQQQMAWTYAEKGAYSKANQIFTQLYQGEGDLFAILLDWGDMWANYGQNEWALEKYQLAKRYADRRAVLYLSWGRLLRKEQQPEAAWAQLQEGLHLMTRQSARAEDSLLLLAQLHLESALVEEQLGHLVKRDFHQQQVVQLGQVLLQLPPTSASHQSAYRLLAQAAAYEERAEDMLEFLKFYAREGGQTDDLDLDRPPFVAHRGRIEALWEP
ncbi:MAG: hypothetical protein AAF399_01860 [Bacteroidota bacterium]